MKTVITDVLPATLSGAKFMNEFRQESRRRKADYLTVMYDLVQLGIISAAQAQRLTDGGVLPETTR